MKLALLKYISFICLLGSFQIHAQIIDLSAIKSEESIGPKEALYFLDTTDKVPAQLQESKFSKIQLPFIPTKNGTHVLLFNCYFSQSKTPVWVKLPNLNCEAIQVDIYNSEGIHLTELKFKKNSSNFILDIQNLPTDTFKLVLRIRSFFSLFIPVKFMNSNKLELTEKRDDLIYSLYFGIIIVMSLYNLFVFFSTRSISYLYYVIYTITFGVAQFALLGYMHTIYKSSGFIFTKQFSIVFSGISGIFGVLFFSSFLEAKKHLKLIYKVLILFALAYVLVIFAGLFKWFGTAFNLLNLNAISVGICGIIGSGYLAYQGNRPARFFFVAWIAFMIALVVFVLTNLGFAPYNNFTKFVLPMGSALEVALLSFALADKINILSQENETLIREQNIILEKQVAERTAELGSALEDLQQAQMQLVNSEKMASLGHLTAGIAHEINNPINFISANVSPLRRDIEDYETLMEMYAQLNADNFNEKIENIHSKAKEVDLEYLKKEIQTLLSGIDEGARRTAEIVKNLKIFSHIDKAEHSFYAINEGVKSTLQLLAHKLSGIYIREDFGDLPPLLCYPGKLNQVFMNILSNAIDALAAAKNPEISVHTYLKDKVIFVEIGDNGMGIPEKILNDIFNPFFTTKDVGSGTGLGLSITISIVQEHGGDIKVKSEQGKGTTFIISLPLIDESKG
ncbi:MAG: sensor histidine kinase [Bacteroidia bacterium]|nr:sensor histidine kinase [Bacteroidia bacterium]